MKYLPILFIFYIVVSCGKKQQYNHSKNVTEDTTHVIEQFDTQLLLGEYVGRFGKNHTLILSINYINGKNVSGYNIVKGKRRNIKGLLSEENNRYKFELKEPGSDATDGTFVFTIDPKTFVAEGVWTPNNTTSLSSKDFKLEKRSKIQDHELIGYWYLDGMRLELKADGSCVFQGLDENGELEVPVKGNWVEKDKKLTIDWAKNSLFKSPILELYLDTTEYGEPVLMDKNKEERGYRYW
jgi:hypothetical protein